MSVESVQRRVSIRVRLNVHGVTKAIRSGLWALLVTIGLLIFGFPILILLMGSFRPNSEMFRFASELSVFSIVPAMPTFDAYGRLLDRPLFFVQLWNTVLSGVVLATLATATSVLAAYPLSRSNLVGRRALFILILGTAFVPLDVVLPPLFFVVRDIGLLDSFWGLVLPFVFSPVSIFLAKQAIDEVPQELEFAAALDGASPLEILRTAVVPNIRSTLLAIWLLNFVFVWEWFLWPVVGMTRDEGQLAQVAITGLLDPLGGNDYAIVFAGAVATVLPAFVVFVLMQRFLVASIISGSGK